MKIIRRFSDNISTNVNIKTQIDKSKDETQEMNRFYKTFVERLKKNKVKYIIVSGLETETHFFQDCIYYVNDLARTDFETLQRLINNLVDIQDVKKNSIIQLDCNKKATRTILEELHNMRSDLFPYTRKTFKDSSTSREVSNTLCNIYLNDQINMDIEQELAKIRRHCYQDVLDDYELLYCYELINKSSVSKECTLDLQAEENDFKEAEKC